MKTALETIRDYPINPNSNPDAMAQAIEAMQAIAADAIAADTAPAYCGTVAGAMGANGADVIRGLLDQISQMEGMFDDSDGEIAEAVNEAEIYLSSQATNAPPARDTQFEQMAWFIKSVAALTTPQDEWEADPQLQEWYPTPHQLGTTYKTARLYSDHCELVALVDEARKILAGEATADSGHVAPHPMKGQTNETL